MQLEKLESKLISLKEDAKNVTDNPHDLSLLDDAINEKSQQQCLVKLRQLRSKILEVEVDCSRFLIFFFKFISWFI